MSHKKISDMPEQQMLLPVEGRPLPNQKSTTQSDCNDQFANNVLSFQKARAEHENQIRSQRFSRIAELAKHLM